MDELVPEDWVWTLVDVTCESCGGVNQLHELPPAMLAVGDVWECRHCGRKHKRGGTVSPVPDDTLLECAGEIDVGVPCGATYAKPEQIATLTFDEDGSWTCPRCGTNQRHIGIVETAGAADGVSRDG